MYPILTGYLQDAMLLDRGGFRRNTSREIFLKAVVTIHEAHDAGSIPNQTYIGCKDVINSAIDEAVKTVRDTHVHWDKLPWGVKEFDHNVDTICPYVNIIPGKLKKALAQAKKYKVQDHPYCMALIALFTDIAPLAPIMADLKTKVVKRQRKEESEVVPGYHPPIVSTEAERQVVALLESVTQAAYDRLLQALVNGYTADLDGYLAAQEANVPAIVKHYSPYDHFVKGEKFPDVNGYSRVGKLITQDLNDSYSKIPNAAAVILTEATNTADFYRTQFVGKNFAKIASIVEGKGNLEKAEAIGHTVSLEGIEGTFIFEFKDGSGFVVVNQVVTVVNSYGTRFLRFPLTFTEVKFSDGKKMDRPSEERMNTIFLGKD